MTDEKRSRGLIIDDDEAVRTAYKRLLTEADFDVRVAQAPYEGLEATTDWPPDVIILDLLMPAVSGFDGPKLFKKNARTRGAILVACSGVISDEEVTRFRRIGFDEILPKPVAAFALVQRVRGFLANRAG